MRGGGMKILQVFIAGSCIVILNYFCGDSLNELFNKTYYFVGGTIAAYFWWS